ncbi:hypothetical protein BJV74DRAFT_872582 [Russula compacta]|nr:hypothetical protein BJV74DRAFT_872582 [Russula compacta]
MVGLVGTGGGIGVGRLGAHEGAVLHFYTVCEIKHLALAPLVHIVQHYGHGCRCIHGILHVELAHIHAPLS